MHIPIPCFITLPFLLHFFHFLVTLMNTFITHGELQCITGITHLVIESSWNSIEIQLLSI